MTQEEANRRINELIIQENNIRAQQVAERENSSSTSSPSSEN